MARYEVSFEVFDYYETVIEAESEEEAKNKAREMMKNNELDVVESSVGHMSVIDIAERERIWQRVKEEHPEYFNRA